MINHKMSRLFNLQLQNIVNLLFLRLPFNIFGYLRHLRIWVSASFKQFIKKASFYWKLEGNAVSIKGYWFSQTTQYQTT